ncbi:MAG: hypothetical protein Q8N18_19645 [Opitutaceae bacterium]|nr:hypothetical protein [Opitutaceae bacterium]
MICKAAGRQTVQTFPGENAVSTGDKVRRATKVAVGFVSFIAASALFILVVVAIPHRGQFVAIVTSIAIALLLASPFIFSSAMAYFRSASDEHQFLWPVWLLVSLVAIASYVWSFIYPAHFNVLDRALLTPVHWGLLLITWMRWTSKVPSEKA